MNIYYSAAAAFIPMVFYLIIIWKTDSYEREPIGIILLNFTWGAFGAILFALIGSSIFSLIVSLFYSETYVQFIETVFIAPFVEEITKGIFLVLIINFRQFDNVTDGIVYGAAIGLGFGMTENFLYFMNAVDPVSWIILVVIRTLFSAVMHCIATAVFGAFLGYAKLRNIFARILFPALGLFIAMFIHFTWNLLLSLQYAEYAIAFMIIIIILFILAFRFFVRSEQKIILNELTEEAGLGYIPLVHSQVISSKIRTTKGWFPEHIRKPYIKAATILAFRKRQYKNSSGLRKYLYEQDINYYRSLIKTYLDNQNY